jgi:transcriptional antiterminator RfaH
MDSGDVVALEMEVEVQHNGSFDNLSRWYALYTHAKQECRAESNLNSWGVETFNPQSKERAGGRTNRHRVVKQVFPRYIFARFATQQFHKITFTRGVQTVVSFGNKPIPVDDEVIALIKSRIGEDGFVRFNDELTMGDRVIIINGPLASLEGIFERTLNDKKRISILLSAVSLGGRLIIERDYVKKLERSEFNMGGHAVQPTA